jgi:ABC-type transport system involved in cytochrome c biogenesis permease subunit
MTRTLKLAFWGALAVGLAGALAMLRPAGPVRGFDASGFGEVPVLEGGRVKPVDSIARNTLLIIRGQQSFRFEEAAPDGQKTKRTIGADEWLLDVLFRPELADRQPIFVINDPDVLGLAGIRQPDTRYFSFAQLAPAIPEIQQQAMSAERKDPKVRNRFETAIVNLFDRMYLYHRLKNTVQAEGTPGLFAEIGARDAMASQRHQAIAKLAYFRPLLPLDPASDRWRNVGEALQGAGRAPEPGLEAWARLGLAWSGQDPAAFDRAAADLRRIAAAGRPEAVGAAGHEWLFNRAQPFYSGMVLYVLALLAVFASWARSSVLLQRIAFGLLLAGALVHTGGLVSRVVLQGRPPVTNLYSSAVFVGWVAVLLGAFLERMYRHSFGTLAAGAAGFSSLIVAHHLTGSGDTMEMMRAVLDSNFWLGTHVVTITIGYAGTYAAGLIGIFYAFRRHLVKQPKAETSRALAGMVYGMVAFSVFFSFLGTVLGGIWADQSWGRFWGWDPKENGALLIVLWNALILHARWGGYVRERGIMAMAIFGNVITSLSWFGVNMLGVGLHSYGFMDSAFWALTIFCGTQVALVGLALAPARFWATAAPAAASDEARSTRAPGTA